MSSISGSIPNKLSLRSRTVGLKQAVPDKFACPQVGSISTNLYQLSGA